MYLDNIDASLTNSPDQSEAYDQEFEKHLLLNHNGAKLGHTSVVNVITESAKAYLHHP
ncbi:hypothetical protein THZG08_520006 [Vibrio owensii]|nr:hypothetical protein THZG08_520006 [Vibrio owensii]CAH1584439.1 hypothetical protein THOA03_520006 [Vibrio owensii]